MLRATPALLSTCAGQRTFRVRGQHFVQAAHGVQVCEALLLPPSSDELGEQDLHQSRLIGFREREQLQAAGPVSSQPNCQADILAAIPPRPCRVMAQPVTGQAISLQ